MISTSGGGGAGGGGFPPQPAKASIKAPIGAASALLLIFTLFMLGSGRESAFSESTRHCYANPVM
jgi:hypothetical protein